MSRELERMNCPSYGITSPMKGTMERYGVGVFTDFLQILANFLIDITYTESRYRHLDGATISY